MGKRIAFMLSLCLLILSVGCPHQNATQYVGTWDLTFDWGCNGVRGEGVMHLYPDGSLTSTDVTYDTISKDAAWGYSTGGLTTAPALLTGKNEGNSVATQSQEKFTWEGEWRIDSNTGLLVMTVFGFQEVRYERAEGESWGEMFVGDDYVGCFKMEQ